MAFKMTELKVHLQSFLDYRKNLGYARPATARSNTIDLKLFVDFMDEQAYDSVSGKAIIAFQNHLAHKRNNTPASINRKIFTLRSFQNYLELIGLENADQLPFKKVLKIRAPRAYRPHFLTEDEIKILFETINRNNILGLRDYAVFALMFLLGLRVGEVHRLDLDDINWNQNTIRITGKGGVERTLTLNNELQNALENYLAVRHNFFKVQGNKAFFISKKGNRLAIRTMEDNFKKLLEASGLNKDFKVTPHILRHSCATLLNENQVKILTIQNILGHSNPNTTINYYLHTTEQKMRDALEKLPLTLFLNELINAGEIILSFQSERYRRVG